MDKSVDCLADIVPGRETWRIKVRVLRMWEVPAFLKPDETNSLEMVLIDQKGEKMHATVRKQLLYVFQKKLVEGEVYKMSFFFVVPGFGAYRTTVHPYKLIFQMKTKVEKVECSLTPQYGLSLTKISGVCSHTADYDYLVDVIGLMTGISAEREYVRDGKVTKMMVFELTDDSGKVECALFGGYVDSLKGMMGKSVDGLPVVVVQFAKVKIFRDKVSLQNVMNTTKIWVNPPMEEAVKFRESVAIHGVEPSNPVPSIGPRIKPSFQEDFLRLYPKKTISQLNVVEEDGTFVVCATVNDLVEGQEWWYPACRCHMGVSPDSGAYYCKGCVKHVFHMVPRYKVKICVGDGTGDAIFVVFDGDMQSLLGVACSSLVSVAKVENAGFYPPEMTILKGRVMLFKVEKNASASVMYDGSFRVKRVCVDPDIIAEFTMIGRDSTPEKLFLYADELNLVNDGESGGAEDPVVVEETQLDDFEANALMTPQVRRSSPEFENTASVVQKVMGLGTDIGSSPIDLGDDFGCITTQSLHGVDGPRRKRAVKSVKRNLAEDFEGAADEGCSSGTPLTKRAVKTVKRNWKD